MGLFPYLRFPGSSGGSLRGSELRVFLLALFVFLLVFGAFIAPKALAEAAAAEAAAEVAEPERAPYKVYDPGPDPALSEALTKILLAKTDPVKGELTGAVFLAMRNGKPLFKGAFGYSDREYGKAMTLDALFRLASVSKAFTAMGAGVLLSKGVIALDDPIYKYLEVFSPENPALGDKEMPNIKVRHILTHTAGFDYGFFEDENGPLNKAKVSGGVDNTPGLTLTENIRRLSTVPLEYKPGEGWKYSMASDVLGGVIASASKKTLPEAMKELLFDPLSLKDTGFTAVDPERLTVHYRDGESIPVKMTDPYFYPTGDGRVLAYSPGRALDPSAWPSGGGGIVSSGPDVISLLEVIRKKGEGVVKEEVMNEYYKDAIAPLNSLPGQGFGASWAVVVDTTKAETPLSKGSVNWSGVYGHQWCVDPEKGISAVLLTNTALKGMSGDTMSLLLKEIYKDL
jgi:CubicO group peptidase (beta-lactamase class C family)